MSNNNSTNDTSLSDNSSEVQSSPPGSTKIKYSTTSAYNPIYSHLKNVPIPKDTTFTKIFVGGLPYHTTDESLAKHFEVYGSISEAVVITERQTGKSRGYGFVTMQDRAGAAKACINPNPIIDGRKANVNLAYIGAKPRIMHQNLLFRGLAATLASCGIDPLQQNNSGTQSQQSVQTPTSFQPPTHQAPTPYVMLGQTPPQLYYNKSTPSYLHPPSPHPSQPSSSPHPGTTPHPPTTTLPPPTVPTVPTVPTAHIPHPEQQQQPLQTFNPTGNFPTQPPQQQYHTATTNSYSNANNTAQQVAMLDYMIKSNLIVQDPNSPNPVPSNPYQTQQLFNPSQQFHYEPQAHPNFVNMPLSHHHPQISIPPPPTSSTSSLPLTQQQFHHIQYQSNQQVVLQQTEKTAPTTNLGTTQQPEITKT